MPAPRSSSADAQGLLLAPGQQIDRYVVDAVLGAGGTATVYKVHHANLGTPYALKVLSIVSPSIRRRTLQEGKLQARMNHRNIVAVYDVFEVDGAPGLLMEYVEGPSLETALGRQRLTLPHAEAVFRAIVDGVRQAHQLGLVHRDLKPANVLLAETSQGVIPKVTDFGIAKAMDQGDSGQTRAGIAMGTPQYMSPEQIRDARSVDRRADIFSLGCLLYELVTGQRTFPHDDIIKVYNHVCDGVYRHPRELVPQIPDRIVRAIRGALTVDREARIPDCDTLLAVFEGRQEWGDDAADGSEGFAEPARAAPAEDDPWAESDTDVRRVPARSAFVTPGVDAGAGGTLLPSSSLITEEGTFTLGDAGVAPARAPISAPPDPLAAPTPGAPGAVRTPPASETWIGQPTSRLTPGEGGFADDPTAAHALEGPDLDQTDPVASPVAPAPRAPEPAPPDAPGGASDLGAPSAASAQDRQALISKTVGIAAALAAVFAFFFLGAPPLSSTEEPVEPSATEAAPAAPPTDLALPTDLAPAPATPAAAPPPGSAAPAVAPRPPEAPRDRATPTATDPLRPPSAAPPVAPTSAPTPPPSTLTLPTPVAPSLAPTAAPAPADPPRARAILNSVPSVASVTIDGRSVGMTPLKVELSPGKHRVLIKSGDDARSFSIDVRADADAKWCYVFDKDQIVSGSCPR